MPIYHAPCKINLSLKVLGKRPDGFHAIETLMAPLHLCDRLIFSPANQTQLICCQAGVPVDESNLVMQALRLIERELGHPVRWQIELSKNVPHGAGLGGGSSDAATTLLALNDLEHVQLSKERLLELAAELGSDVGFFIDRGICRCSGRGEIVTALPEYQDFEGTVLLLKPAFGVSTPDAYGRWATSTPLPRVNYETHVWHGMEFVNDLERPVFEKFLFLAEIKMWLLRQQGVHVAMMSGSGSTMFAFVDSVERGRELAKDAKRELDPTLWSWVGACGA
ncbi:MAG: 4-(cytidine 5'-diphospho)-2-C-methyl-D-erythritol kinase [Akkermansia sp.]